MLSIGKLGTSRDQLGYYERQVAQGLEDYLSGRGEASGRWVGGGCGGLGLRAQVERTWFMRAMAGGDPAPVSVFGLSMGVRRWRLLT